jgi:hypothetical protein
MRVAMWALFEGVPASENFVAQSATSILAANQAPRECGAVGERACAIIAGE